MMNFQRIRIITLLLLVWSQACPSVAKSIGIAVLSPHNISFLKVGFTVFGNEYSESEAGSPQISDALYSLVEEELKMEKDTSVTRIDMKPDTVRRLGTIAYDESSKFFRSEDLGLKGEIGALAELCQCHEILVISDANSSLQGTNQVLRGVTILRRSDVLADLRVPINFVRFDAATFKVLGSSRSHLGAMFPYPWPSKIEKITRLTEDQMTTAANRLISLKAVYRAWQVFGIREALTEAGLRPSCGPKQYDFYTPADEKNPSSTNYKLPPTFPETIDPKLCN